MTDNELDWLVAYCERRNDMKPARALRELRAERDALRAKADVCGGEWCAANRAEGRGPCGACAWCCNTLKAELADLRIRVDLDALGGHERDAVELVERRAEVARLTFELEGFRLLLKAAQEGLARLTKQRDEFGTRLLAQKLQDERDENTEVTKK